MSELPTLIGFEDWHALSWEPDEQQQVHVLTLGQPVYVERETGLVDADSRPITRTEIGEWSNVRTVMFTIGAEEYSIDEAGSSLPEEKVFERHLQAVATTWQSQVQGEQREEKRS